MPITYAGGNFSPVPCRPPGQFQAAPAWTPAAICQDTGSSGCRSRRPGAALMSLFLFAKVYHIFLIRKKNSKKYLISLIIKHLQRGIFAVKRFNNPCAALRVAVLRWRWLPVHPPTHAHMHVCMQAQAHRHTIIKTFCFRLSAS